MDIDRAIEDVARLMAVDGVEQLVAGQDATVGGEDRREELELDRCEVDSGLAAAHLMACRVDDEIGMADDRSSSTVRSRCRWLGPAQDRLDPKDQLRRRERLGQIVVRAVLEPCDPIERGTARRQDKYGRTSGLFVPPDSADHGATVEPR